MVSRQLEGAKQVHVDTLIWTGGDGQGGQECWFDVTCPRLLATGALLDVPFDILLYGRTPPGGSDSIHGSFDGTVGLQVAPKGFLKNVPLKASRCVEDVSWHLSATRTTGGYRW